MARLRWQRGPPGGKSITAPSRASPITLGLLSVKWGKIKWEVGGGLLDINLMHRNYLHLTALSQEPRRHRWIALPVLRLGWRPLT